MESPNTYMNNHNEEGLELLTLTEAINKENTNPEILNKIKFFITNKYINPHQYKIDLSKGIFYNVETQELLEVIKNAETQEYQIYKSNYENNLVQEKAYENVKVKRLIKPDNKNAAFIKNGLILITIFAFSIIAAIIFIKYKIK